MVAPYPCGGRTAATDLTTDELLTLILEMANTIPITKLSRPDLALAAKVSEYLLALDHELRGGGTLPRAWGKATPDNAALQAENAELRSEVATLREHITAVQQILEPPPAT